MNYQVGVISGDGIGPEVVREAKKVLDKVGQVFGHTFSYDEILMGGVSIDATGMPLTEEAIAQAQKAAAILALESPPLEAEPGRLHGVLGEPGGKSSFAALTLRPVTARFRIFRRH